MNKQKGSALVVPLVWMALVLALIIGWGMNVYDVAYNTAFDPLTGLAIARVVGIFVAPVGAVLGLFS